MSAVNRDLCGECEAVLAGEHSLSECVAVETRRREGHQADIRLVFADQSWLRSASDNGLIAAFQEHPMIESANRRKSTIHLRFTDQALAELEGCLAAGEPAGMGAEDLLAGYRVTISYVGPNTNKALHVGHLRNIVIGEALASAFTAAGATVRRHNLVGDIGRRMCEAMAGYLLFHNDEDPADVGLGGDRFVELCSHDYSRSVRSRASSHEVDPNAEERQMFGDMADALMREWLAEATPEVELWRRMRAWAIDGHQETLARLGVIMDHCDFESDATSRAATLIEEGLRLGVLEREEAGGVVFRTNREEYPTMVLMREDGFPTEHARLLGTYDYILENLAPGEPYVEVAGFEWQPAILALFELSEKIRPGPHNDAHLRVYHGSVTSANGDKIGSSVGGVVWADDFLDDVTHGPGVASLEKLSDGAVSREELADILVRGTFLCAPPWHPLAFVPEAVIEGRPGPGWTIAEAWCRAQSGQEDGEAAGPVARTAVMQTQQYRRSLHRTVKKRDVTSMTRYLMSVSEACLAAPSPGPAAAPILRRVLGSLGFLAGKAGVAPDGAGVKSGAARDY